MVLSLSDQLYQRPAHFLLELVQNADDNTYAEGVTPSLRISLSQDANLAWFRSDCNEMGFTSRQIDALSSVGASTKKDATLSQRGYIGEKGIGFKSVFKVAKDDEVVSGFYEFKLDRLEQLGMILPTISPFPAARRGPRRARGRRRRSGDGGGGGI